MPAKKQTQAEVIAQAISILAPFNGGKVLEARLLLETITLKLANKATSGASCKACSKPLGGARTVPFHVGVKLKGLQHYGCSNGRFHPVDCACTVCVSRRAMYHAEYGFPFRPDGTLSPVKMAKLGNDWQPSNIRSQQSYCANCQHHASHHVTDNSGNEFMKCDTTNCKCDHFRSPVFELKPKQLRDADPLDHIESLQDDDQFLDQESAQA